ncbi:MAG: xanthine dehydrogenase family protein subunit M [Phenylobacterium sp.]|uniref:FAD binding domain-containing protein n=1 Tax=Phenylobacterium sp. TaxID=1871053 RepID=UPI0025FA7CBE|nr:xanthine dehydrogenase family protein subunit M [Phenylobacterium sp.]MBI1200036.1 xanthine dehydrogenase family protein subunit M [Phenylobacterium sp.]
MSQLAYLAPSSPEEAAKALAASGARPLSGGTDLLVQLRSGRTSPSLIVDLKRIAGAVGIREEAGGFVIGASTSGAVLGEHAGLLRAWPGVVEGANLIGSTQVQGRASLAGNLCNASPAADGVPALVAARATCVIVGPNGRREAPVESIPAGPGKTSLAPGEFILEFRLPARPPRASDAYLRLTPRTEMDIAVAGAGVNLVLHEDGTVAEAHVALGAVAPTVLHVEAAGAALVGTRLEDEALAALAAAAQAACKPISDKRGTAEYRTRIAGVLARRAAVIAYQRAGGQR